MSFWHKDNAAEWAYRALVLIGLAIIGWLNSHYASREELFKISDRVSTIETALKVMVEANRVNDRQDNSLADHETRLRRLELSPR